MVTLSRQEAASVESVLGVLGDEAARLSRDEDSSGVVAACWDGFGKTIQKHLEPLQVQTEA